MQNPENLSAQYKHQEFFPEAVVLQKNLKFKEEAKRLLSQAENDAFAPLKRKLNATVKKIGMERGYAFVLNTDGDACPYVDSTKGDDISVIIADALK